MRTLLLAGLVGLLVPASAAARSVDPTRDAAVDVMSAFLGADAEVRALMNRKARTCLAAHVVDALGVDGLTALSGADAPEREPAFFGVVVGGLIGCRLLDDVLAHELRKQGVRLDRKARACLDRVTGEQAPRLRSLFETTLSGNATPQDELAMGLVLFQCLDGKTIEALTTASAR